MRVFDLFNDEILTLPYRASREAELRIMVIRLLYVTNVIVIRHCI